MVYVKFNITKPGASVKGYVEFNNLSKKDYDSLKIEEEECKKLVLFDEMMGYSFIFNCWTEILPVPGEDDGIFAYVDGSSTKTGREGIKETYGTGVVFGKDKNIYFCHSETKSKGANFTGEIVAATELLKNICDKDMIPKDYDRSIRVYFDNTAVGYYPAGLFDDADKGSAEKKEKHKEAVAYKDARNIFYEKYKNAKLEFVHVDGHFDIFGNEMADRVAQVNYDDPGKHHITKTHKSDREKACPNEGEFSEAFTADGIIKRD